MSELTAAAYAAILDPEHQQKYWWTYYKDWIYYGPPDLHTAREHSWRGEDWLEARNIGWIRHMTETLPAMTCVMVGHGTENPSKVCNPDHAAAIAEAVRRVNDGQK